MKLTLPHLTYHELDLIFDLVMRGNANAEKLRGKIKEKAKTIPEQIASDDDTQEFLWLSKEVEAYHNHPD